MIRNHESTHEYQHFLFAFSEKMERVLMVLILLGLGSAILNGLLAPLTWPLAFTGLLILFVIRPLAGMLGLLGFKPAPWRDRIAISFFGVRGIGSLYYLSYALNEQAFEDTREIWALVGFTVLIRRCPRRHGFARFRQA